MDGIVIFPGQIVGSGLGFIVLFLIVACIPPLKRFPLAYWVPAVLGTLFAIAAGLGATAPSSRGSPPLAALVAIGLGIWYAAEAIRRARRQGAITRTRAGATALMRAAEIGDIDGVEQLLSEGASAVDAQDSAGGTALHYAILNKHLTVTMALLNAGASPTLTTRKGRNALFIAQKVKWQAGCALLEERMAGDALRK